MLSVKLLDGRCDCLVSGAGVPLLNPLQERAELIPQIGAALSVSGELVLNELPELAQIAVGPHELGNQSSQLRARQESLPQLAIVGVLCMPACGMRNKDVLKGFDLFQQFC
ncbi:hypothetical protein D9M70_577000 [compost metagenome]